MPIHERQLAARFVAAGLVPGAMAGPAMALIRTRQGVGGTKYQALVHTGDHKTISRTFRKHADAKTWAAKEDQRLKRQAPPAQSTGDTAPAQPEMPSKWTEG